MKDLIQFLNTTNYFITNDETHGLHINCANGLNLKNNIFLENFIIDNNPLLDPKNFESPNFDKKLIYDYPIILKLSEKKLKDKNIFCCDTLKSYLYHELKGEKVNFNIPRVITFFDKHIPLSENQNSEVLKLENIFRIHKELFSFADINNNIDAYFILEKPIKISNYSLKIDYIDKLNIKTTIEEFQKYFNDYKEEKIGCLKKEIIELYNKTPENTDPIFYILKNFDTFFLNIQKVYQRFVASHSADILANKLKKEELKLINNINKIENTINSGIIALGANAIGIMGINITNSSDKKNLIILIILIAINILETIIFVNSIEALIELRIIQESTSKKLIEKFSLEKNSIKNSCKKNIEKINKSIRLFKWIIGGIWLLLLIIVIIIKFDFFISLFNLSFLIHRRIRYQSLTFILSKL